MSESDVTKRLMSLLDQAADRQEHYAKLVKQLSEEKQRQAEAYLAKLDMFYQLAQQLTNRPSQTEAEYRNVNIKHLQALQNQQRRDFRKTLFSLEDSEKFGLVAEVQFMYFTPLLGDYLSQYYPTHLELRFCFNGHPYSSGILHHSDTASRQEVLEALSSGYPFVLLNQKDVPAGYNIELHKLHRSKLQETISFMERDCLNVELWDCDSRMLYAQCKLPLKQLLYYGAGQDLWVESYDLFSPLGGRLVGKLDAEFKTYKMPVEHSHAHSPGKLKAISSEPMRLSNDEEYDVHAVSEKEQRMLRRISKYKEEQVLTGEPHLTHEPVLGASDQRRRLAQIQRIKEENKHKLTEQILSKIQELDGAVTCPEGEPMLFSLPFTNEYTHGEKFYITIEGLEKGSTELSVVSNPAQWEFYCKDKGYEPPSKFSLVDQATGSMYLLAHQSVTLLVRFLTWRKSRSERQLRCIVSDSRSQVVAKGSYRIVPAQPRIDHVFRLYDFAGRTAVVDIPFGEPVAYKRYRWFRSSPCVYSTQPDLQYSWARKNTGVSLKVALTKHLTFVVYIYSDERHSKLLYSYQLELNVYPQYNCSYSRCEFEQCMLGREYSSRLQIPPLQADTEVRLVTSDPSNCWLDGPKIRVLKADTVNSVTVTARSFVPNHTQLLLVNCLSNSSQLILHQWLLRLKTSAAQHESAQQAVCSTVRETLFRLPIHNPKSKKTMFGIVSSNQSLVQIPKSKRELHAHETSECELTILPREESEKEVFIIMSDREQTVNVCHVIKLLYSQDYKDEGANS